MRISARSLAFLVSLAIGEGASSLAESVRFQSTSTYFPKKNKGTERVSHIQHYNCRVCMRIRVSNANKHVRTILGLVLISDNELRRL